MKLYPFQTELISAVRAAFADGKRRVLVYSPTGSGKTVIATSIVDRSRGLGRRVLYVVPSDEILDQTSKKLAGVGVEHTLLVAGKRPRLDGVGCVLAMSQTLARRLDGDYLASVNFDLIILDEGHKFLNQHIGALSRWPRAYVVVLTASPCRLDGQPLRNVADVIVQGPGIAELQRDGYLVPAETFAAESPDLHRVKTTAGDYDQGQLQQAFRLGRLVGSVPDHWLKLAQGRRTITFAAGVDHSRELVDAYRAAGIRAEHIDATTRRDCSECLADDGVPKCGCRRGALARLRAHRIDVLCNVGLFVEGLDLVETECITLATATKSLSRYLQMVGRGLRLSPRSGKRDLVIIDHGGNVWEHDPVDEHRVWSLDGPPKSDRKPLTVCKKCQAVYRVGAKCPTGCAPARAPWPSKPAPPVQIAPKAGTLVKVADAKTRAQVEREARAASKQVPPRPCPQWAERVADYWNRMEQLRAENGYALPRPGLPFATGFTETRCLRRLTDLGLAA